MNTLKNWYLTQTKSGNLVYDTYQFTILQQLDTFITNFTKKPRLSTYFTHLFKAQKSHSCGVYIYGAVGRGKSMIMNEMYEQITTLKKIRLHFHEFMSEVNQKLNELKSQEAPLKIVARDIAQKYSIIFLDEFHVSDIATAMILKNLLISLFSEGIIIVTSSNFAPNELYPDGLMHERFLPAIELLEQELDIVSLNSPRDYRGLYDSYNQMFIIGEDDSHNSLNKLFGRIADDNQIVENSDIIIQSRKIPYIAKSAHIIWFNFDVICGDKRSQLDYLELSGEFDYFVIEGIAPINEQNKDVARRFTWLIDVLYDRRRRLILSSGCRLEDIYPQGDFAIEFERTVSRLTEMQTSEYLTQNAIGSMLL